MNIINTENVPVPQYVHDTVKAMALYGHRFTKMTIERNTIPQPGRYSDLPIGTGVHVTNFAHGSHSYKVTGYR